MPLGLSDRKASDQAVPLTSVVCWHMLHVQGRSFGHGSCGGSRNAQVRDGGVEVTIRWKGLLTRSAVFVAVLAAFVGWAVARPAIASASPPLTLSYYVDSESSSTLENWGCSAGSSGNGGAIILDFGRPAYRSSDGSYGTIDFHGANGVYLPNGTIKSLLQAFAQGWYTCSPVGPKVVIARGTNNCANDSNDPACPALHACPNGSSPCTPSFSTAGTDWGNYTNDFGSYISSAGFSSQESAAAANDAEPAWNPGYSQSRNFTGAYNTASGHTMFDYGAAYTGYWTNASMYYIAYGLVDDFPFPEVYAQSQANEWESLDKWGASNGSLGAMYFEGVMCTTQGLVCGGSTGSWEVMLDALQSSPSTDQSGPPYLTKIYFP